MSTSTTAMLSVKEAAARATVCERIVRGWVRDGLLPHYRVGSKGRRGKILIDPADLDALKASFRVEAGPAHQRPAPSRVTIVPELKHLRVR